MSRGGRAPQGGAVWRRVRRRAQGVDTTSCPPACTPLPPHAQAPSPPPPRHKTHTRPQAVAHISARPHLMEVVNGGCAGLPAAVLLDLNLNHRHAAVGGLDLFVPEEGGEGGRGEAACMGQPVTAAGKAARAALRQPALDAPSLMWHGAATAELAPCPKGGRTAGQALTRGCRPGSRTRICCCPLGTARGTTQCSSAHHPSPAGQCRRVRTRGCKRHRVQPWPRQCVAASGWAPSTAWCCYAPPQALLGALGSAPVAAPGGRARLCNAGASVVRAVLTTGRR